ncbi:MAG: hypothetical protein OMM_02017 [Candidatus Magnetoglobus multicellularis str. Araruama]|uniref:histidine kinase n=1 Tax=Candidatus Magnetoglobus multicellularis str. Araruama TaxID=890399 RepID=A0A1V1PB65_9BACT|nr:MAG: hypothetical protein OMM_02017 [Candidatus Magnetoglobus multicellularis str. Araruama]
MATILIVDDDPTFVHLLTNLIASFGETPISATQGASVFQIMKEEQVDLILLDIYMPIISGMTLIKQLKNHKEYQHIPVIMITGSGNISLMTECFEAGASDFITKPVSPVVLQARLSSILEKQKDIARLEKEITERKKAEAALRKLSVAVEQSPDILFLTDAQYRIEYANPKCLTITGYQLDEVFKQKPTIFQAPNSDSPKYDHIFQTVSKKGTWKGKICNQKKNGEIFWVSCSISPILNDQGQLTNYLSIQEDITDRIKAEYILAQQTISLKISENRLRTIIEATADGIVVVGRDKHIHFINPAAESLLGQPAKKLLGELFQYPLDSQKTTEIIINRPEAGEISADLQVVETETDDGPVWVASIREVPQRTAKLIPEQPTEKVINSQLQPHDCLLNDGHKHASNFLSNISHEFRTPMHAILSFAGFGIKKIHQAPPEKLLHYFEQIKLSANRLMPLINDLLDLSSLESGKLPFKTISQDIVPVILSVIQEQQKIANEKHISITLCQPQCQTCAIFNKNGIIKVIRNILQNAIHFSAEQSVVSVEITNDSKDNRQWLRVRISDEGIGIPENDLINIFCKFFQCEQIQHPSGGTGMGLAICKHIILEHGGNIWAENNPDKGACFSFTLPVTVEQ